MKVRTDLRAAVLQDRQIPPGIMLTVQEIQEQRIPVRVIQTVEMVLMTTVLMTIVLMMTAPMMKGIMMRVLMMIPDINRIGLRISI